MTKPRTPSVLPGTMTPPRVGAAQIIAALEGDGAPGFMEEDPSRRRLSVGSTGRGDGQRTYRLEAVLDRGGMGELYVAEMTQAGRRPELVVIKRLLPMLLEEQKYIAMFVSEAKLMARLDHPNIVRVVDMPMIDGMRCLAMELVRGRSTLQIIDRAKTLGSKIPPAFALGIMIEMLQGLEAAHRLTDERGQPLNLVHRDVTPGNILVSYRGAVKLTDFGIAKSQLSGMATTAGIVKGKARYLSPEQILGEAATPRSDVFAAACVAVELLTGEPLFDRGAVPQTLLAIVNGDRRPVASVLPFHAPELARAIESALAHEPRQRIPTAAEFGAALERAARSLEHRLVPEALGRYVRDLFRGIADPFPSDPAQDPADDLTVRAHRSPSPPPTPPMIRSAQETELAEPRSPRLPVEMSSFSYQATELAVRHDSPVPEPQPRDPPLPVHQVHDTPIVAANPLPSARRETRTRDPRRPPTHATPPVARPVRSVRRPLGLAMALAFVATFVLGAAVGIGAFLRYGDRLPERIRTALANFGPLLLREPTQTDIPALSNAKTRSDEIVVLPVLPSQETASPDPVIEDVRPLVPVRPALLDVLHPRGARVEIDGRALSERVPVKNVPLEEGDHRVRVQLGRWRREYSVEATDGARIEIGKRTRAR